MRCSIDLLDYYQQKVVPCRDCEHDEGLGRYLEYAKLPPFVGAGSGTVMLLGHSPRVRTDSKITVTLDLNSPGRLQKYIVGEVLTPLGIDLASCTATNVVKCVTNAMPEEIEVDEQPFMTKAFQNCRTHLVNEIHAAQPKLIISFSQRVALLLQQDFGHGHDVIEMREVFATLRSISVAGNTIKWIPVVHLPKPKVRDQYFPMQTQHLFRLRGELTQIFTQS